MKRLKLFLWKVLFPFLIAMFLAIGLRAVYMKNGAIEYFLAWICIGMPFGIRRMFLFLIPRNYDLAGTIAIVACNVIAGGIIGGFVLIAKILCGLAETLKG